MGWTCLDLAGEWPVGVIVGLGMAVRRGSGRCRCSASRRLSKRRLSARFNGTSVLIRSLIQHSISIPPLGQGGRARQPAGAASPRCRGRMPGCVRCRRTPRGKDMCGPSASHSPRSAAVLPFAAANRSWVARSTCSLGDQAGVDIGVAPHARCGAGTGTGGTVPLRCRAGCLTASGGISRVVMAPAAPAPGSCCRQGRWRYRRWGPARPRNCDGE